MKERDRTETENGGYIVSSVFARMIVTKPNRVGRKDDQGCQKKASCGVKIKNICIETRN